MTKKWLPSIKVIKSDHQAAIATLKFPTHSEHYITIHSDGDPNQRLQSAVQKQDAIIICQFVFAGMQHSSQFLAAARCSQWPIVWLRGDPCQDKGFHSAQAIALSGTIPRPVYYHGRNMGFIYEDDCARYCRLSNVLPANRTEAPSKQARSVFETAAAILAQYGFCFTETVRTWIYLDRLLEWYEEFNTVRTAFFEETGVFDHILPASTGIGAANSSGASITMDVFAAQPRKDQLTIKSIASPLQRPAFEYRSSFGRAVELKSKTHRRLLISGTASIDADGRTAYPNDPEKQIRHAMNVVKAILESQAMDWNNLYRGIAYFKDAAHIPIYSRIASDLKIAHFPLALAHANICRQELVFEIELDAIAPIT